MSKFHITTREMTALVDLVNQVCTLGKAAEPAQTARWQHWRNESVRRLHGVYKPAARRYAREAVIEVGASLREKLQALQGVAPAQHGQVQALQRMAAAERARADGLARENEVLQRLARETGASQSQLDQWAQEKAALQEQIAELETSVKRETPARVTLPARPGRSITIRSAMQQRILQLMGAEGLGRGWRIAEYVLAPSRGTACATPLASWRKRAWCACIAGMESRSVGRAGEEVLFLSTC